METELIVKRLHISGLTPSITLVGISHRLATFGTVKELDGFGKLDALGQPKKYGYVTLEGTKGQLAKCEYISFLYGSLLNPSKTGVNVLSGSTWKDAKLCIGDAKPDYQERSVSSDSLQF